VFLFVSVNLEAEMPKQEEMATQEEIPTQEDMATQEELATHDETAKCRLNFKRASKLSTPKLSR